MVAAPNQTLQHAKHPPHDDDDDKPIAASISNDTMKQTDASNNNNNTLQEPVLSLSKHWSVRQLHPPLYTGGPLYSNSNNNNQYLLTLLDGDLLVLDPYTVQIQCRLRGMDDTTNDDNIDSELLDAEAIVCYAACHNNDTVWTAAQNGTLRQYQLVVPTTTTTTIDTNDSDNDKREETTAISAPSNDTPSIRLVQSWGKSGHTLPISVMKVHSSGVFVATGSVDGTAKVWDQRGGGFLTHHFQPQTQSSRGSAVTALCWKPNRLVLAIGRVDGSICVHPLVPHDSKKDTATPTVVVLRHHQSAVTSMVYSCEQQQDYFVTAGRDAVVTLWKVEENQKNQQPSYSKLHTVPVYENIEGMVLLPDSNKVVTVGSQGVVKLWERQDDRLILALEQSNGFGEERGGYLQLTSDNEHLIVSDAEHNITFLSKTTLETERNIVGHNDEILDLKVLPNNRVVVATNSSQIKLFDQQFSCTVLDRHTATVLCVDASPCGRFIASCGKDKSVRIWNAITLSCVAVAEGHTEAVGAVALSRKAGRYEVTGKAARNGGGAFCVSASMDRTMKRWNLPGATELETGSDLPLKASVSARAHEKDINVVSISPNDALVATGSQDKTAKLWNAVDLSPVATLKGHRRGIWDCQFSPYDRVLATGSGDKTIKLWSLSDFSCVRTFQGHVASVLRVRFLCGGLQLLSSGADGLIKLWTVRTNEAEATMDSHEDKVWALDLTPNGKRLVSGGADSRIVVWEDTTRDVEAAKQQEENEAMLVDQKLANHLRRKEFAEALAIAFEREKPHLSLKVLVAIIEADIQKGGSGLDPIKEHARDWSDELLLRVLRCCREWTTRARNCHVAMLTIKAIMTSFPLGKLANIDGVPEILAGIIPYAERHFERVDRLHSDTYILDFALSSMGVDEIDDFDAWESQAKLVLPPKFADGRVDAGGRFVVGGVELDDSDDDRDEVVTIGDSDSDDSL